MKITQLKFNRSLRQVKQRGAAVVEFALLLVLLLMFVAGVVEFGRAFWYYDALTKATRDGARYLSNTRVSALVALDAATQTQARLMVVDAANLAQVPNFTIGDVTVSCEPNCDAPVYVTVAIDAYPMTIGGWIPIFLPVGSTTWSTTLSPYTAMRYMK
jgi:Flp pilus assembly protein TadG